MNHKKYLLATLDKYCKIYLTFKYIHLFYAYMKESKLRIIASSPTSTPLLNTFQKGLHMALHPRPVIVLFPKK